MFKIVRKKVQVSLQSSYAGEPLSWQHTMNQFVYTWLRPWFHNEINIGNFRNVFSLNFFCDLNWTKLVNNLYKLVMRLRFVWYTSVFFYTVMPQLQYATHSIYTYLQLHILPTPANQRITSRSSYYHLFIVWCYCHCCCYTSVPFCCHCREAAMVFLVPDVVASCAQISWCFEMMLAQSREKNHDDDDDVVDAETKDGGMDGAKSIRMYFWRKTPSGILPTNTIIRLFIHTPSTYIHTHKYPYILCSVYRTTIKLCTVSDPTFHTSCLTFTRLHRVRLAWLLCCSEGNLRYVGRCVCVCVFVCVFACVRKCLGKNPDTLWCGLTTTLTCAVCLCGRSYGLPFVCLGVCVVWTMFGQLKQQTHTHTYTMQHIAHRCSGKYSIRII